MNIIPQPAAFRIEERTIDVHAAPDRDGLVNATLTATTLHTAESREDGLLVFSAFLKNPARHKDGHRLVLVEDGDQ